MAAPRTAKIITASTIEWASSGGNFDGFVLFGLNSGGDNPSVYLDNATYVRRLPTFAKFRVTDGVIDAQQRLFWTADLQPPNSRYWAWWYDLTGALIYPTVGDPTGFTIAADPYTLTVPTLTPPSAPAAPPETASFPIVSASYIFQNAETPTGTINSTTGSDGNGTFTLANEPDPASSFVLYRNGILQLSGTDYSLAGSTITYVSGRYPVVGDWHRAFYRYQV